MLKQAWQSKWRPDAYYHCIQAVPFKDYAERGYRIALLDIDNTLMPHGQHGATSEVCKILDDIRQVGLEPIILSNAKAERAAQVASDLGCRVIGMAMKPSAKGIQAVQSMTGFKSSQMVLVGDQLFTDIWAGHRGHVRTVLLKPIQRAGEPIQIKIKRFFEDQLLKRYQCQPIYDEIL